MKIERKKLILIIAIITTLVLLAVVIVISALTGGKNSTTPSPSPTTSTSDNSTTAPSDSRTSESAPIGDPSASGAPPSTAYQNDYSKDTGYTPLPDGFDGSSNPANTVFDQSWALAKMQTLACELSTKPTVTERALTPLTDFSYDLNKTTYANAQSMRETINTWIQGYTPYLGQRAPGNVRNDLISYCQNTADMD